ncbi:MAG TPA: hypothetical protein VJ505_01805 [Holophagaceae bacterium]|nr:hypothetical protein [Holophagaceae bacterium]
MADSNWNSPTSPVAPKAGMPLWGKILIGCGIALLLALGSCVAGVAYISHKAKQDPEGMKKWAMGFAMDFIKPEWDDFRGTVEQLRTEEGCKALYKAQPALAKQWSTVDEFLKEAQDWRDQLPELPAEPPTDLLEKNELSLNNQFGGETRIVFRKKGGIRIELVWDRARRKGDSKPRRLLHLEVS